MPCRSGSPHGVRGPATAPAADDESAFVAAADCRFAPGAFANHTPAITAASPPIDRTSRRFIRCKARQAPRDRLRQGYGGPPKRYAKAEGAPYISSSELRDENSWERAKT